jgi:hypothetical protein
VDGEPRIKIDALVSGAPLAGGQLPLIRDSTTAVRSWRRIIQRVGFPRVQADFQSIWFDHAQQPVRSGVTDRRVLNGQPVELGSPVLQLIAAGDGQVQDVVTGQSGGDRSVLPKTDAGVTQTGYW